MVGRDRDGDEIELDASSHDARSPDRADSQPDSTADSRAANPTGDALDDRPFDADSDLADELGRISIGTTAEGHVEARVLGLEPVDDSTVRLDVRLPHGRRVAFSLEKPIPWSEEFLLTRLVESLGYDAASIEHVVGETVYVTRTDLETAGEGWDTWNPIRAAVEFVETSLDTRFGEHESGPTWRLVDPRELPDPAEAGAGGNWPRVAMAVVVFGAVVAAFGAAVGATGSIALSPPIVLFAIPGLALVCIGLLALRALR